MAPPPRRWNQVLTQAAPFTVQLTIRPWILVPNARETLIWGSDFLFFWQRVPKTPCFRLRAFGVRMGGGGATPPLSKIAGSVPGRHMPQN